MKKLLAILLAGLVALSMVACANNDANDAPADDGTAAAGEPADDVDDAGDADVDAGEPEEVVEEEDAGDADAGDADDALQAIIDEAQSSIDAMSDALGDTMSIAIEARGSALVYVFTYNIEIDDIEGTAAALEEGLAAQESVYTALVGQMGDAGVSNPSVVVEYLAQDGTVIYSQEYK